MKRTPLDQLWIRFIAGETLDLEQQRSLVAALAENEEQRHAYLADRHLDGVLHALARTPGGADAFVKNVGARVSAAKEAEGFVARVERQLQIDARKRLVDARRPRRRVALIVSMAVVATTAAAFALWPKGVQSTHVDQPGGRPAQSFRAESSPTSAAGADLASIATLAEITGTAFVVESGRRTPARQGQTVRPGQAVLTPGAQSAAHLRYEDGSTLHLGPDTHLALSPALPPYDGHRAFLFAGTVRAAIAKQRADSPMILNTPHAVAEVLGTQFVLIVTSRETVLRVDEGRVRLQRKAADAIVVLAGHEATARDGMALTLQKGGTPVLFLVRSSVVLEPGDAAIKRRLDALGLDVRVRNTRDDLQSDLRDSAILLISSTLESLDVNTRFRDLPIPVITWESGLFDDFGMTGALEQGGRNGGQAAVIDQHPDKLVIVDPAHPLAAGLTGTVRVTSRPGVRLRWGTPGPAAAVIAIYPGNPSQVAVFGYERGATMVGMIAPARRVALFLGEETAPTLTEAGWALFDAAIRWCLGGRG